MFNFVCFGILTWDQLFDLRSAGNPRRPIPRQLGSSPRSRLQPRTSSAKERNSQTLDVCVKETLKHWTKEKTMCVSKKSSAAGSPNNLRARVPLVLFPWERRNCLFGSKAASSSRRSSGHQSLCGQPIIRGEGGAADSTKSASHKQEWVAFNFVHYRIF